MVARYVAVQMAIGIVAFCISLVAKGWVYWTSEIVLTVVSMVYSLQVLHSKTRLWQSLRRRFSLSPKQ